MSRTPGEREGLSCPFDHPCCPGRRALKLEARRRWRHAGRRAALALAAVGMMATVAGCGSRAPHPSPTATVSFPDTSAGRQARWLFGAVLHQPIPDAAITAHFDRAYLATLPAPAPAALNASFVGLQRLQLDSITTSTPDTLVFIVTVNG